MADTSDASKATARTADGQPINITITPATAPPVVTPTPGMDETVPGGAYRQQDGSYVDSEGREVDKPKGKA